MESGTLPWGLGKCLTERIQEIVTQPLILSSAKLKHREERGLA